MRMPVSPKQSSCCFEEIPGVISEEISREICKNPGEINEGIIGRNQEVISESIKQHFLIHNWQIVQIE